MDSFVRTMYELNVASSSAEHTLWLDIPKRKHKYTCIHSLFIFHSPARMFNHDEECPSKKKGKT
jgi:hypothetical protein